MSDHYTTREVAQLLGMAVRSVQLMVDRGDLQAWKTPGGHRRISRESVLRWRAGRGAGPAPGLDAGAGVDGVAVQAGTSDMTGSAERASDRGVPGAHIDAGGLAIASAPALGAAVRPGTDPSRPAVPARRATDVAPGLTHGGPAPVRLLLIEDSIHFQNLVGLLLRQSFPSVDLHVADDGIAGLAMAGRLQPDVLVVDILLPGIDGGTLITSLRSHPQFASTQLIVVTSLDEGQRAPYAFALSGVPVVHKPRLVLDFPPLLRRCLEARAHAGDAVGSALPGAGLAKLAGA